MDLIFYPADVYGKMIGLILETQEKGSGTTISRSIAYKGIILRTTREFEKLQFSAKHCASSDCQVASCKLTYTFLDFAN